MSYYMHMLNSTGETGCFKCGFISIIIMRAGSLACTKTKACHFSLSLSFSPYKLFNYLCITPLYLQLTQVLIEKQKKLRIILTAYINRRQKRTPWRKERRWRHSSVYSLIIRTYDKALTLSPLGESKITNNTRNICQVCQSQRKRKKKRKWYING